MHEENKSHKKSFFVQRPHAENMDVQGLHIILGSLFQPLGTGSEDEKNFKFFVKAP